MMMFERMSRPLGLLFVPPAAGSYHCSDPDGKNERDRPISFRRVSFLLLRYTEQVLQVFYCSYSVSLRGNKGSRAGGAT